MFVFFIFFDIVIEDVFVNGFFFVVCFIKEIGCGVDGVCVLVKYDVWVFFIVMLEGCIFDVQFGVIFMVYCIKGEILEEFDGMLEVMYVYCWLLLVLDMFEYVLLVVILSYNGVCCQLNFVLLLVKLLVCEGVLVLVYGICCFDGCIIMVVLFEVFGWFVCEYMDDVCEWLESDCLVFVLIDVFLFELVLLLDKCEIVGLCNLVYMVVKMLQFIGGYVLCEVLWLVSYMYLEYCDMFIDYFLCYLVNVLFVCGIEGEVVVDVWCGSVVEWLYDGVYEMVIEVVEGLSDVLFELFVGMDVIVMVWWIEVVFDGM